MKPAIDEVKDGPQYFLAGEDAIEAYCDGNVEEVKNRCVHDGSLDGIVFMWDPETESIGELLAKTDGCLGVMDISKEEYEELSQYD